MSVQNKNSNRKAPVWIAFILFIAVISGLIVFFTQRGKNEALADDSQSNKINIPFSKQGTLAFIGKTGNDTISVIDIEVADNDQRRARGLMYRSQLPADAGMLFIFDEEDMQSFWMKNTYIPLDMLFVNAGNEIVTIHANTTPLQEWNYASTKPALYVVEVNAGYCARKKIAEGDKISFNRQGN